MKLTKNHQWHFCKFWYRRETLILNFQTEILDQKLLFHRLPQAAFPEIWKNWRTSNVNKNWQGYNRFNRLNKRITNIILSWPKSSSISRIDSLRVYVLIFKSRFLTPQSSVCNSKYIIVIYIKRTIECT